MRFVIRGLLVLYLVFAQHIAWADIAVVTASESAIGSMSLEEAQLLYLGRLTALRDRTPVQLLDLPPGDTRDAFYQRLTGRNPVQIRAYWSRMVFTGRARPPQQVASDAAMVNALLVDLHSVGYLPVGSVPASLRTLLTLTPP